MLPLLSHLLSKKVTFQLSFKLQLRAAHIVRGFCDE